VVAGGGGRGRYQCQPRKNLSGTRPTLHELIGTGRKNARGLSEVIYLWSQQEKEAKMDLRKKVQGSRRLGLESRDNNKSRGMEIS